jgi:hypothetical protein
MRPPGKRPLPPEGGFKSQAQLDQHLAHSVRSVDEIHGYHERSMALNRRARAAWRKLHEVIIKRLKSEQSSREVSVSRASCRRAA